MSGILFLIEVIAFVVVALWAYANDRSSSDITGEGLLGMKGGGAPAADSGLAAPRWKRQATRPPAPTPAPAPAPDRRTRRAARPAPRWSRPLKGGDRP